MYQHGKRVYRQRNYIIFLITVVIIGIVTVVSWFVIHRDIGSSSTKTSASPIISEVEFDTPGKKFKVNEALFTMELPADWKLSSTTSKPLVQYEWASTAKGADDRKLTLQIDYDNTIQAVNKLLPVSPSKNKLMLGGMSDDCVNFTGSGKPKNTEPFPAKWQNVSFLCDPITIAQTAAIGSTDGLNGIKLPGSAGTHKYFIYYTDHNAHPDYNIFRDALDSFQVK